MKLINSKQISPIEIEFFEDIMDVQEADIEEMLMLLDQNVDKIETIIDELMEDLYFENLEYEIRYN